MSSPTPVRLLINGARGKMGARIHALARDDQRFIVIAAIDRDDSAQADSLPVRSVDAIIDFSSEHGALRAAELAQRHGAALLVGTTGLPAKSLEHLRAMDKHIALMIAPNTSLGVAVLNHLIAEAARLLGPEFNIDMIEAHHTMKKDAPSGTALRLAHTLESKAGVKLPPDRIHCIRAGDIIGEHTLQFAGPGERITIAHAASNRDLFARGALWAAAWLAGKHAGNYSIEQALGIA